MGDISVPATQVCITSKECTYKLRLNKGRDEWPRIIPNHSDISGIHLQDLPDEIEQVCIYIGNYAIATFDRDRIQELVTFPIYMSLSYCMYTDIEFVFNKEWVQEHEEYELVDEYREHVEYGQEEVEVFDGGDYHYGCLVTRTQVPTGKQVRQVIKGADVTIPSITFDVIKQVRDLQRDCIEVPVTMKINMENRDQEFIKRMIEQFNLRMIHDTTMGYVTNVVRYQGGYAALKYCIH